MTAQAMLDYKANHPERLQYPWATEIYNDPTVIQAYQDAVTAYFIESYCVDARLYSDYFKSRWDVAVLHGVDTKTYVTIGFNQFVDNFAEVRRQMRYARRMAPDMNGIGFYSVPGGSPLLAPAIDRAIEEYYLNAVLLAELDVSNIVIKNIGQTDALGFDVVAYDAGGSAVATTPINALAAQAQTAIARPGGTSYVRVENQGPWSTALDETEDYGAVPAGKSQPLTLKAVASTDFQDFSSDPGLTTVNDTSGNVLYGTYDIPPNNGGSLTITFDINFSTIETYGTVEVGVWNKSADEEHKKLKLRFFRNQLESGISGCRVNLEYLNPAGETWENHVHELMFAGVDTGTTYTFTLHFENVSAEYGYIRALCSDAGGLLWDSGKLWTNGGLDVDVVRFDVGPYPLSDISVSGGKLNLNGGSASFQRIVAAIDGFQVDYINDLETTPIEQFLATLSGVTLSWESAAGESYRVLWSETADGSFKEIDRFAGTGSLIEFSDVGNGADRPNPASAGVSRRFYKVEVIK